MNKFRKKLLNLRSDIMNEIMNLVLKSNNRIVILNNTTVIEIYSVAYDETYELSLTSVEFKDNDYWVCGFNNNGDYECWNINDVYGIENLISIHEEIEYSVTNQINEL